MTESDRYPELEREQGNEIVRIYRAWRDLEKAIGNGVDPIDFDLAPQGLHFAKNPFTIRAQVIDRLQDMGRQIETSTPTAEFLGAKVISSIAYLKALEGEDRPIDEYIGNTLSVEPALIPQQEIDSQYVKVKDFFGEMDFRFTPEGWDEFFQRSRLDPDEIKTTFTEAKGKFLPIILDVLGKGFVLEYEETLLNIDAPWISSISGDASGFHFRINLHRRNESRWFLGATEALAIHEMVSHLVQAYNWRQNIVAGQLSPSLGVTSIPGPEQWTCEGMADTLVFLISPMYDGLSMYGKFAIEYKHLQNIVNNNVHLWINQPNADEVFIRDYIQKYIPSNPADRITYFLNLRKKDPKYRSYLYAYSSGGYFHRKFADSLSESGRIQLVKDLYERPMTPTQIQTRVAQLRA